MDNSSYISPEEYHIAKQNIYDDIKYIFNSSDSVYSYKTRVKKLRKCINNRSLLLYFDRIRDRFLSYKQKKEEERFRRLTRQQDHVHKDVKGLFNEASGLHSRGSAFEQGNFKCSTKLIYIAKKN